MENHKLILPEHLNQYGFLFGGNLLKWVDEVAWIAASLEYPGCHFVTVAMDRVEFHRSVRQGAILRLEANRTHAGTTSVRYQVNVTRVGDEIGPNDPLFTTEVALVRIDAQGRKTPLPANGSAG